ncbi:MAG: cation-translocating P-type ATPase [Anaerocolumna aminovalerica]|jgi:Ca2+-transporting ATPase|uniref:cation-translocating P-type ATPase n=1 Tax=Anaerocolumna aminovalerica TaxID=1527 RepID=UPI000BE3C06E|nr:cation-translocating P-type ATPase [Anaerocolumna aminovalerica]MBU5331862.1 cation-translocating P-type ATPase [Anaerocolumna aminovalerica]MDU6264211.1 cation-translocating P-type ATPase [Anaerocolumna aminovalerica]
MWFSKSKDDVTKELNVNPSTGLTTQEAKARLEKYGLNKLKGKPKKSLISLFFAQLKDMLIYVLLAAAVITIFIGEYVDSIIILLVVLINAVIGVVQEAKAEKAVEALQKMTTPKSLVRRDGEVKEINSEEVVPGDIVILDAGRFIPADLRLLESANLQIEESALTGESVPSNKDADDIHEDPKTPIGDKSNMAFMSTLVTYGRGEGIVVATAMETEIGTIAKILDEDNDELTPLQKRLEELGKVLGYLCIGICVLIFGIALLQGRDLFEMFLTAISLAVAAIPEGLAAIVAIVLALGVTRMSKINAIVKKLPAVETLGSVNIICSDKTGTLTQNKMTVVKNYTIGNLKDVSVTGENLTPSTDEAELIRSFVLCSDATYENGEGTGDPTEIALVVLGDKYNMKKSDLNTKHKRVSENPFDSDRKLMSTLNVEGSGYRVHTKGAIDNLLKISTTALVDGKVVPLTENLKSDLLKKTEEMSDGALRVLGVAYKDTTSMIAPEDMEKDLTVIGIVGMIDPPRLEVKDSIKEAKLAGITPIMITGDHKNTAVAIAKELGIAESIEQSLTGAEIDELSDEEFSDKINNYRVFARVSPEHKVKIVRAFKAHGNIVSMTGDGVNDAPSLKYADIGVAMGITGTDVAKGASDMILTDDNFTTIVNAIEEGRNIYNNIKKSVIFLLSCNLGEVITVLLSIIFKWPIPLTATQLLWINLITDALPAIALGVDPGDKDVMKKKPRNPKESFFAGGAGVRAVIGGVLIGSLTLLAFYFGLTERGYLFGAGDPTEEQLLYARTMAFVVLAGSQLFYSLSVRNSSKSIFKIGLFSNMKLIGAIIVGFILQEVVISIPVLANAFNVHNLPLNDWAIVLGFALIPLIVNEIIKFIMKIREEKEEANSN